MEIQPIPESIRLKRQKGHLLPEGKKPLTSQARSLFSLARLTKTNILSDKLSRIATFLLVLTNTRLILQNSKGKPDIAKYFFDY